MAGHVHYEVFKKVILSWKARHSSKQLDDETILEAFVACGGEPNGDGNVNVGRLV